jgi:predicted dehydrogenase
MAKPISRLAGPVRYAVVGAGHISQIAALPGFANADNSKVVAVISGDPTKRSELERRYDLEYALDYDGYERLLGSGDIDAVYIGLPNHLHCKYTVAAARAGVHVLCEKPLAVTEEECEEMMRAADDNGVCLMTAYRLHFEPAHLDAITLIERGDIGQPRFFTSSFSQDVRAGNVRLLPVAEGGGPLYDMGVYCINAARYLFRDEPFEVSAIAASRHDPRFAESPEMVAATLRFHEERVAQFVVSFGASDTSRFMVVGERGRLVMEPAYDYAEPLAYRVTTEDGEQERKFDKHDQFGAQIYYFSECILTGRRPEPDGDEGLADVRIVRALHESAAEQRPVTLRPRPPRRRPRPDQAVVRPGVDEPEEIRARGPGR